MLVSKSNPTNHPRYFFTQIFKDTYCKFQWLTITALDL